MAVPQFGFELVTIKFAPYKEPRTYAEQKDINNRKGHKSER